MPETEIVAPVIPAADTPVIPAESAPATPEPTETPTAEPQEKAGKNRFQRRLDTQTRKFYEEKARADFLEGQLKKFQPPTSNEGEPKLEEYSSVDDWKEALTKHVSEKAVKDHQTAQANETQKQAHQNLISEWEAQADKGSSKYDDFDEVVGELKPISPLHAAVMRAGPDVAYYLASHKEEALKIANLQDPVAQLLAVGRLDAKLQAEPPKAKTPSKAPDPIAPVSGKSANLDEKLEDASMRDFIRIRNKQEKEKRAR